MAFTINRLRVITADDAGFFDLVSALPDGADTCLCCGHRSRDSLAMILVADESDDNPFALCTAVYSMCSTVQPTDQLLADWAERLAEHRRPDDKVQWRNYVGVYLRDANPYRHDQDARSAGQSRLWRTGHEDALFHRTHFGLQHAREGGGSAGASVQERLTGRSSPAKAQ